MNHFYGYSFFHRILWKFGFLHINKSIVMHDPQHDYALMALLLHCRDNRRVMKLFTFGAYTPQQVKFILADHGYITESQVNPPTTDAS